MGVFILMHILHVTPYFAPAYSFGGVVSMLEGLTQAQLSAGHQVTVLTSDAYSLESPYDGNLDEIRNGIRVIRCRNWFYPLRRYNLDTPFSMASQARKIIPKIDIVHLHEFRTVENLLVTPIAAQHNKPVVLSPHGTLTYSTGRSQLKSLWDKWLSPRVAKHIQHVIALAQSELDDAQKTWQQFSTRPDFSIVPNGVNPAQYNNLPDSHAFREKYNLGDSTVVLFKGRLHQRKGVDVLAKAFKQANLPGAKLVLAGPDEGMRPLLESLADENIILTGFLTGEERLAALASANLFALPAIGEGLSMAVLEAMASGLPVLLSEGCNLPEAAEANAGKIVPVDVDSLANALTNMLSNRETLTQQGKNAQTLIQQKFTWDRIAAQMTAVYERYV